MHQQQPASLFAEDMISSIMIIMNIIIIIFRIITLQLITVKSLTPLQELGVHIVRLGNMNLPVEHSMLHGCQA